MKTFSTTTQMILSLKDDYKDVPLNLLQPNPNTPVIYVGTERTEYLQVRSLLQEIGSHLPQCKVEQLKQDVNLAALGGLSLQPQDKLILEADAGGNRLYVVI